MTSLPRFSVDNPVLVNVLMAALLIGGVYCSLTLVREMFPESRPNQVLITTPYPGATPAEVEKGISTRIEEAIKDVENIDKIETQITEGLSSVIVSMTSAAKDIDQVVNDFKAAVDAIPRDELPEDAEETRVLKFEPMLPVISVSVFGDVDERTLKDLGRRLRDDLLLLPGISDVELGGTRKSELTVEVDPEKLVEYRLSLSQVADAIHQANLDLPGGQLETPDQNVAVRTLGETDDTARIEQTIVRTTPTGEVVRVSNVGRVIDDFEDTDVKGRYQGKPAVDVTVFKRSDQDAVDIAAKVKAFVAGKRGEPLERDLIGTMRHHLGMPSSLDRIWQQARDDPYPTTVRIETYSNLARFIESRLDLLKRNGLWGLTFVFLSLLLFLNWRIAFWVMMGLLVSISGAIMLMSMVGATLNLISMFGLIVVLGLIVDDAIVVGENVYTRVEEGEEPRLAAVRGAEEVTWPVFIAVLTTIGAFLPLLFIEGQIGDFMGVLPVVVTCALAVSLIEAFSILPSHLAEWLRPVRRDMIEHAPRHRLARVVTPLREAQQRMVNDRLLPAYERVLRTAVSYRYVTVAAVASLLLMSFGLVASGRVPFVFVQKMDSETIVANLEMPVGTPSSRTEATIQQIEQAVLNLPGNEVNTIWTLIGARLNIGQRGATASSRSHVAQAIIELPPLEERERTSEQIIAQLRQDTAGIAGANSIRFLTMQGGPGGAEIEIEITGKRIGDLVEVSERLKNELAGYPGVFDIDDDFEKGRREVQIELLDSARPLNLTTRYLATEIRGAFYGLEARTLQRDREDVDIRVRFPEERRRQIYELESMRIATPGGRMVPFREVARLKEGEGYSAIRRVNQRRAVVVSADVDQSMANAEEVLRSLEPTVADLESSHPGVRIEFAGNKREMSKSLGSLKRDFFIAILVIAVMLAGLFKSYIQPLVVLTAVPFGLNGAIAGHYFMGYPLTILSTIGLVALTGIVVNDALILVSFINQEVGGGTPVLEAVIRGGRRRLRPIILTSLTTILGLAPLMTETSFQARFLIPMAISISFGLAFATVLTLVVVPAIYMIVDDVTRAGMNVWYGSDRDRHAGMSREHA
jgi:multidrug efflux pump subunit AcrB